MRLNVKVHIQTTANHKYYVRVREKFGLHIVLRSCCNFNYVSLYKINGLIDFGHYGHPPYYRVEFSCRKHVIYLSRDLYNNHF